MYIYHIYHKRTSMIFTTNSYGFRTLQDAVSTSTITYHISSRGTLENIWRCYFKDAGSACANPGFSKGPLYVSNFNSTTVQYSKADMLYGYFGEEAWSLCIHIPIRNLHLQPPNWSCSCWYSFNQPSWGQEQKQLCQVVQQDVFQLFWDIISMSWALIENGRFVAGTVSKGLARTSVVQKIFDWSGKDRSLPSQTLNSKPIKSQNLFRLHWLVLSAASQESHVIIVEQ